MTSSGGGGGSSFSLAGAAITQELANGQRNVNICVISDSTGVDTVEQATGTDRRWVYLLAQLIGQDFPAYTVQHRQWNATNLNYDAATVIQVGGGTANAGGPFTLTVYGATKSGATVAYWLGELVAAATVFPAAMDLVLLCDGHNETGHGADTRGTFYSLVRAVQTLSPGTQTAWVTQNPQNGAGSATTPAEAILQLLRQEEVRKLARSEGLGLIEVQPSFLSDPSYATDLLNADGVHPNPAGSRRWAQLAHAHFPAARDQSGAVSGGPIPRPTRLYIPAGMFGSVLGAPARAVVQNVDCWQLLQAVDGIVSCLVDIPAGWQTFNAWVHWALGAAGTGLNWRGRLGSQRAGGSFEPASASGATLGSAISPGTLNTIAGIAANRESFTKLATAADAIVTYNGRPYMFQIERLGTDAGDTLTQSVDILGLYLERAA